MLQPQIQQRTDQNRPMITAPGTFTSIKHMAPATGPTGAATDTQQTRRPKSTGGRSPAPQGRTLDGVLGCEVRRASHQHEHQHQH